MLTPSAEPNTPVVEAIPAAAVDATLEASESLTAPVDNADDVPGNAAQVQFDPTQEVQATAARVAEEDAELHELEATTTQHEEVGLSRSFSKHLKTNHTTEGARK